MTIDRTIEILNKWEFFYGQRAGRELWADKATEVQDEDIANFCRDLGLVREALEQTRWIPCSERLPEKAGFYLVATPRGIEIMEFSSGDKRYRETPCFVSEALGKVSGYVTHWMLLPEPPEEELP